MSISQNKFHTYNSIRVVLSLLLATAAAAARIGHEQPGRLSCH